MGVTEEVLWTRADQAASVRLRCDECGATFPLQPLASCEHCAQPGEHALNETLVVEYDLEVLQGLTRLHLESGPPGLWRWRCLLPIADNRYLPAGVGDTPLVPLPPDGGASPRVWAKVEGANPSGSFKDRAVAIAGSAALAAGTRDLAVFTSGNMGAAVACFAAAAGARSHIFLLSGAAHAAGDAPASPEKLRQAAAYGAEMLTTRGGLSELFAYADELRAALGWEFLHRYQAFEAEGDKTAAFEICLQRGWRAPEVVIVPVGTGTNLVGLARGFEQLHSLGLTQQVPRLIAVQPAGADSLRLAVAGQLPVAPLIESVPPNAAPPLSHRVAGQHALNALRRSGGTAVAVSDEEMLEARRWLAQDAGLLVETASAAALAGLRSARLRGDVSRDEDIVLLLTSSGLKDLSDRYPEPPELRFLPCGYSPGS